MWLLFDSFSRGVCVQAVLGFSHLLRDRLGKHQVENFHNMLMTPLMLRQRRLLSYYAGNTQA
jgi:hypothetical protein